MNIPAWVRSPAGLTAVLSFAVGIIGTLALALEIGHPFGGYLSYSVALVESGQVAVGTPGWWPIYDVEPEFGGDLLTVDGQPYTSNVRAAFAQAKPGDSINITFRPDEAAPEESIDVPVLSFSPGHYLDVKLPDLIVAIAFWLLGIVVLKADPGRTTNQVFATLLMLIATHRLLNVHTLFIDNTLLPNVLEMALRVVSALIAATAFHFAWLYPSPLPNRPRWLIAIYYVLAVILAVALVAARFTWWPPGMTVPNQILNTIAFQLLIYLYLGGLLAISLRFIYSTIRENETRRERKILLVTAFGFVLAMPFLLQLTGEVIPIINQDFYWNDLDLRVLVIAIPFAFSLAIIRYQNLSTPSPTFVFVVILAASALIANIAAWLWRVTQPQAVGSRPPFAPFFITILAASIFWSLQPTWGGWLGRFFQREQLNHAASRDLGRRVQGTRDMRMLPAIIAQAIADELELDYTAVWQANEESGLFELAAQAGEGQMPLPARLDFPAVHPGTLPIRVAGSRPVPEWLQPLAAQKNMQIVAPLYNDVEPIGLLGFGPRRDEDIFDNRDLVVIELIGQQAQLYLQVAKQIHQLRQVPQQISTAQERERTLMAAELHDTIQQFLGRLPFFLVASKEAIVDNPQEAADLLERSLLDIQEAAVTVQQIRHTLAPIQVNQSLTRSLNALVAQAQRRHGMQVKLTLEGDLDGATTLETRHALYRVIQHALDNANLHAETDRVSVNLHLVDGQVHFEIADHGRGATPQELILAQTTGHFGLQSMQARVEACGGEFAFESTPGKGTHVRGWVPATAETGG